MLEFADERLDDETIDDLVELVKAEMGTAWAEVSPERLVKVMLGRLGYATEEESPLPDITPGEWRRRTCRTETDYSQITVVSIGQGKAKTKDRVVAFLYDDEKFVNAQFIAGSKAVSEAACKLVNLLLKSDYFARIEVIKPIVQELHDALKAQGCKV